MAEAFSQTGAEPDRRDPTQDERGGLAERPGDIGPYLVLRELGRGGQGVVYLAEDRRLDRNVAIKILTGAGPATPSALARFRREAEVASRLDHPGLASVFDIGSHEGLPYFVMRHVEGETLARRIDRERAGASRDRTPGPDRRSPSSTGSGGSERDRVLAAVDLFEAAARALHAAHEAGVIHRDIKPGNIMVTPAGAPVIFDFGLARDLEEEGSALTRSGDVIGTPAYMAPEQIAGRTGSLDRRADVWSLGAALYETLTLERPFEAPTREGLYQAIVEREPSDPRRRNRHIPRDLAVVVGVALEKDPGRRYASALDLAEDLRRVRDRVPVRARPAGPMLRSVRWAQRHPAAAVLVSSIFIVLGAALAVATLQLREIGGREQDTRRRNEEARDHLARQREITDGLRLSDLLREAEEDLWPARPGKIPEFEAWLEAAAALERGRDEHLAELRRIEDRTAPQTEGEIRQDAVLRRERFPRDYRRDDDLLREQAETEADLRRPLSRARRLDLEESLESVRRAIAIERTTPAHTRRLTFRFEDAEDTRRHASLTAIVDRIDALEPVIHAVKARRDRAVELMHWPPEADRAAWERCRAEIAADPRFRGLALSPQTELRPLGRNPASGFWEFWQEGTGTPPEGGAAAGAAEAGEESALVLVLLPGGRFAMGVQDSDPAAPRFDPDAKGNEVPVRDVNLAPFFLGKHEMTQGQWLRIMETNPSKDQPGSASSARRPATLAHPVESVSWPEAVRTLRRIGLVLPTEAQWEFGCRGGTDTVWATGNGPGSLVGRALFNGRDTVPVEASGKRLFASHAPAGHFGPNPFGLHEMHGNVREWCLDAAGDTTDPVAPGTGERQVAIPRKRVYRGGSIGDSAGDGRSGSRVANDGELKSPALGFRAARTLEPEVPAFPR